MKKLMKSLEGSRYEILSNSGDEYTIRFLDTGYIYRARKHLVFQGKVFDPTPLIKEKRSWSSYETERVNNSGLVYKTFLRNGNRVKLQFADSGYTTEAHISNVLAGKVKDPLHKSLYGVGYLGSFDKSVPHWKQAKQLWSNMIKRCYSEKDIRGYFGDATVDERWHSFENFLADINSLSGFDEWIKGHKNGIKYNLDKDFIKPGNKIYSRYLCCFLPDSFNKAMAKSSKLELGKD